jgi:hypothetical protein
MQKTVAKPSSKHPQAGLPEYKPSLVRMGLGFLELRCPPFHPCKKQLQNLHPNTLKPVEYKPSLVRMGLGF